MSSFWENIEHEDIDFIRRIHRKPSTKLWSTIMVLILYVPMFIHVGWFVLALFVNFILAMALLIIVEDLDNAPPWFYLSPLVMTIWVARLIFLGLGILGKFIKRKYEGFNKWFDSKFENKKHA